MPTLVPNYAPADLAAPRRIIYHAALFFAAAPMVVGVTCLAGYWATRWDGFALAGFTMLIWGLVSVFISACLLVSHALDCSSKRTLEKGVLRRRVIKTVLLNLLNFPLAFICMSAGAAMYNQIPLSITNSTSVPATASILIPEGTLNFGTIQPGKSKTIYVRTDGGKFQYLIVQSGNVSQGVAADWPLDTVGPGNWVNLRISKAGVKVTSNP